MLVLLLQLVEVAVVVVVAVAGMGWCVGNGDDAGVMVVLWVIVVGR